MVSKLCQDVLWNHNHVWALGTSEDNWSFTTEGVGVWWSDKTSEGVGVCDKTSEGVGVCDKASEVVGVWWSDKASEVEWEDKISEVVGVWWSDN